MSNDYDRFLRIQELKAHELVEGDIWCLVSKSWYDQWEDACLGRASKKASSGIRDASSLGPVDNTDVTDLKPQPGKDYDLMNMPPAVEGEHIELVPKAAHDLLEERYALHPAYTFRLTSLLTREGQARPDTLSIRVYCYSRDPWRLEDDHRALPAANSYLPHHCRWRLATRLHHRFANLPGSYPL